MAIRSFSPWAIVLLSAAIVNGQTSGSLSTGSSNSSAPATTSRPLWTNSSASITTSLSSTLFNSSIFSSSTSNSTAPTLSSNSSSSLIATPTPSVAALCPEFNGTRYNATSGRVFIIECNTDHVAGNMGNLTTNDLRSCIQACDATNGCVDVSFLGDTCYLKSNIGQALYDRKVNGARLLGVQPPLTCPGNNGTNYTTSNGHIFEVECGIDRAGGDIGNGPIDLTGYDGNLWLQTCIDECSNDSECVDVSLSGSACYLKGSMREASANVNVSGAKLVYPAPAPVPTSTSSSASSSSTAPATPKPTALTCPGSDGETYTAPSGKNFTIECGIDHNAGDLTSGSYGSFEGCIDACDSNPRCVDVSLSGAACYLKSSIGTSITNSQIWGARLQGVEEALACPSDNGTTYTSPNGDEFLVLCYTDYNGGNLGSGYAYPMDSYDSNLWYEKCFDTCANTTSCVGVALSGSACYLKSSVSSPLENAGVLGGQLISPPISTMTSSSSSSSPSTATPTPTAACNFTAPTCPDCDGQHYPSQQDATKTFLVECYTDYAGNDLRYVSPITGLQGPYAFQECMEACASVTSCVDVSFQGSACYLKSKAEGNGTFSATVWGGKLLK